VQALVQHLGAVSHSKVVTRTVLSSGVQLISKPSSVSVPPWQLVSAALGGIPLRAATWWAHPQIPTTIATTSVTCSEDGLGNPGPVEIATSGEWQGTQLGLTGVPSPTGNHANLGVSLAGSNHFAIFGDMNRQATRSEVTTLS
jgi:hypothetical protein